MLSVLKQEVKIENKIHPFYPNLQYLPISVTTKQDHKVNWQFGKGFGYDHNALTVGG